MEKNFTLLAHCEGNSPVIGEFPSQGPVMRSFDIFFDLRLIKRLSKQWWHRWFETPSRPLWRHYNESWVQLNILEDETQTISPVKYVLMDRVSNTEWEVLMHRESIIISISNYIYICLWLSLCIHQTCITDIPCENDFEIIINHYLIQTLSLYQSLWSHTSLNINTIS